MKNDEYYMKEAIKEAIKAYNKEEIPVGAIIVDKEGNIISRGHNNKEQSNKVIGHAEIEAITKANKKLQNWRLNDCIMYVTLEPCDMCKKVIEEAKLRKIVYCLKNSSLKNKSTNSIQINNKELIKNYDEILKDLFNIIRSQ